MSMFRISAEVVETRGLERADAIRTEIVGLGISHRNRRFRGIGEVAMAVVEEHVVLFGLRVNIFIEVARNANDQVRDAVVVPVDRREAHGLVLTPQRDRHRRGVGAVTVALQEQDGS